jgi:photosystem II stability/assembly factor-like uncharacterized protein
MSPIKCISWIGLAAIGPLLAACQGRFDDRAVNQEKKKAVLRTDQFQGVASNGRVAVAVGGAVAVVSDLYSQQQSRRTLDGTVALIDVAACPDGSFVALDFYRKVWLADPMAKEWQARSLAGPARPLGLTCDPANRYWVVGSNSSVASSADKGQSWQQQGGGEDAMLNTVQFVDDKTGFITGEFGTLMATVDGGASWQKPARMPDDFYPYAAHFSSPQAGVVAGLTGAMLQTTDGGKSWQKLANASGLPQYGLARQGQQLYSVGAGGSLLRLENTEWKPLDYGKTVPGYVRGIAAIGTDRLLIAGGAGVIRMVTPPAAAK